MLNVTELAASYGMHEALSSVSLHVEHQEIVVILGANGAGKSTLLKAIAGICEGESSGEVTLDGASLVNLDAEQIVEAGIAFVPEGRGIFGDLSVQENLLLGAYADHARDRQSENFDRVLTLFPKLGERRKQIARTMSGGEQQMVAIGRALMSAPTVLMLDEPSLGLSPLLCKELFSSLRQVRDTGVGILLVEQNAKQSLGIADRGYLLENGKIVGENTASELLHDPAVQAAYLGGAVSKQSATAGAESASTAVAPTRAPSFTPRSGIPRTQAADSLIGDNIDALVARATSVAASGVNAQSAVSRFNGGKGDGASGFDKPKFDKPRFDKPRSVTSHSGKNIDSAAGPPVTNLLAASSDAVPSGVGNSNVLPPSQDARVQKLLADFEAAALAASGSSAPASTSSTIASTADRQRQSTRIDIDDVNNLPHIPVYRKSPVTVYRRDGSGTLRKQDR